MQYRYNIFFGLLSALALTSLSSCRDQMKHDGHEMAQGTAPDQATQQQIEQQRKLFIEALEQRNSATLAELWAEDAIYRNPFTNNLVTGRSNIKQEYDKIFKDISSDASIVFEQESLLLPFEDKAVERGISIYRQPGKPEIKSAYKMTYRKKEGVWTLTNISGLDLQPHS